MLNKIDKLNNISKLKNRDYNARAFEIVPCTANEGLVRIQYKCLVPIYVFPEMELLGLVISKTEL
jgi:hypothetical protein